jgi:acetyl esterase/lipase
MRHALAVLLLALPATRSLAEDTKTGTFEVETVKDVAYQDKDSDKVRHKLDLYLPRGEKNYPVLFFIHGGGWRNGSKNGFAAHGKTFARQGIGFVAINYRLSPTVQHPDHIKDVARAFAFARADLKKRGADVSRIYVSGHSAGGHLCALLACDESYLKEYQLSLKDIKGCIPISGVFTVGGPRMSAIFGSEPAGWKNASPMSFVARERPEMLLFYADKDLGALGKQALAFTAAMKKAGASIEVKMIKNRDHGSIMRNAARPDDEVTKAVVAFIRKNG